MAQTSVFIKISNQKNGLKNGEDNLVEKGITLFLGGGDLYPPSYPPRDGDKWISLINLVQHPE
jgi:hypothetical protein